MVPTGRHQRVLALPRSVPPAWWRVGARCRSASDPLGCPGAVALVVAPWDVALSPRAVFPHMIPPLLLVHSGSVVGAVSCVQGRAVLEVHTIDFQSRQSVDATQNLDVTSNFEGNLKKGLRPGTA